MGKPKFTLPNDNAKSVDYIHPVSPTSKLDSLGAIHYHVQLPVQVRIHGGIDEFQLGLNFLPV